MDSMRNNQFEEEYDGSPVEADVATLRRAKVAGIDSGHPSDWLEPGVPDVETLADLEANPLQACDNRLVSDVRRLELQQLGCVGEELVGGHGVHLNFGWRLHVHIRVDLRLDRCRRLAP